MVRHTLKILQQVCLTNIRQGLKQIYLFFGVFLPKVQPQPVLLCFYLIFCQCQLGVPYKSVCRKEACNVLLIIAHWLYFQFSMSYHKQSWQDGRIVELLRGPIVHFVNKGWKLHRAPLTCIYLNKKWCPKRRTHFDVILTPLRVLGNKNINMAKTHK